MLAAGATPKPIVSQIARDLAEALTDPALIQQYQAQGVSITSSPPEAFDAELRSDAERYGKLVAAASG